MPSKDLDISASQGVHYRLAIVPACGGLSTTPKDLDISRECHNPLTRTIANPNKHQRLRKRRYRRSLGGDSVSGIAPERIA